MSEILDQVKVAIAAGKWRFSSHAIRELSADGIVMEPLVEAISTAIVVEAYPDYHKGPCVLVLQRDELGQPLHLLWGLPSSFSSPAVLITAYRPDPKLWSADWMKRRTKQ